MWGSAQNRSFSGLRDLNFENDVDTLCALAEASAKKETSTVKTLHYLKRAESVLWEMHNVPVETFTGSSKEIIMAYAEAGKIEKALALFRKITEPSWTIVLDERAWQSVFKENQSHINTWKQEMMTELGEWFALKYAGDIPVLE